ncbi:MAG: tyrosine-type recombinase/integrase [Alistipes sp.]|nr:tyrosine-type recombinase/integrase [Alistipes sp.]
MRTRSADASTWAVLERLLMPANALVVEVMLRTGLRVSDVLSIRTEQLARRFTVEESKTGKHKRVYIGDALCARLRAQAGAVYVFEGAKSPERHRTRQAVWTDLKRAARALRLPGCVAPHSCRKSYACDEFRKSGSVGSVQAKLGHDRIETTLAYLLDIIASDRRE